MKNILRKKIVNIRKNLPRREVLEKSKKIEHKLFSLKEFKTSSKVLFYVSYDNEVYTHDMIKKTLKIGKKVVVPLSDTVNRDIIPIEIKSFDELKTGSYGILEPVYNGENIASLESIELVIVPGIVFDIKGYRVGHGLGYYDKFLKKTKAKKIGLAFEFQVVSEISYEEHDIKMDKIVTEDRIIDCLS